MDASAPNTQRQPFGAHVRSPPSMVDVTSVSASVSLLVATLALALAGLAYGAARKRSNRALHWVALAFLIFTVKNLFSAYNVVEHTVPHDAIELVLSLFDLALLGLLFLPLVFRRRA